MINVRHDHLQTTLIQLHFAADTHIVAGRNILHHLFRDIPHQAADDAGAVAESRKEIQISVAISAKLFIC